MTDQEIKDRWSKAVSLARTGSSPFARRIRLSLAHKLVDELEAAGVTEADIDRLAR